MWTKPEWQGWTYDSERHVLTLPEEAGGWYEVALREAAPYIWLRQVEQKTWATDSVLAGLARALLAVSPPTEI